MSDHGEENPEETIVDAGEKRSLKRIADAVEDPHLGDAAEDD